MKDSILISLMRGRVGAGVLAILSGLAGAYGITEAQQADLWQMLVAGGSTLAGVLAWFSKFRESRK